MTPLVSPKDRPTPKEGGIPPRGRRRPSKMRLSALIEPLRFFGRNAVGYPRGMPVIVAEVHTLAFRPKHVRRHNKDRGLCVHKCPWAFVATPTYPRPQARV